MNFLQLFGHASFVVQLVMLMLLAASVWGWTIFFQKLAQYRIARRQMRQFEADFWSGEPLDDFFDQVSSKPRGAGEKVFVAGMTEWRRSVRDDGRLAPGVIARIDRAMDVVIGREAEGLGIGLGFLATTASAAPFVGLFGTVWGIMTSFQQIAESGNTSLAVVAPGIAEALMATGLGLLAAIPAVIFYNKLSADRSRLVSSYEAFADEFSTLLSREVAGA